jgi:hypothetical protein
MQFYGSYLVLAGLSACSLDALRRRPRIRQRSRSIALSTALRTLRGARVASSRFRSLRSNNATTHMMCVSVVAQHGARVPPPQMAAFQRD